MKRGVWTAEAILQFCCLICYSTCNTSPGWSLYSGPRLLSYGFKNYADDAAGLYSLASEPATAACHGYTFRNQEEYLGIGEE